MARRLHIRSLSLLPVVTLLWGTPTAGAGVTAAEAALARLESRVERLRGDVAAARRRVDAPAALFAETIARLRRQRQGAIEGLAGQRSTALEPALRTSERLQRHLALLEGLLADWPRRPERELRPASTRGGGTGALSGRLLDAVTGAPLTPAHVHVHDDSGSTLLLSDADELGLYTATGLEAGTYFVVTHSFEHLNELYDDLPCDPSCDPATGTPIAVTDGATTAGIDFALFPLSTIEGTLTDAATGQPLASVSVTAYDADGFFAGSSSTNSLGRYRVFELPPGIHFVVARSDTYLDQLHDRISCEPECDPQDGSPVLVPVAGTVTVDFALSLGGNVSGLVTDAITGEPVQSIVRVFDAAGTEVAAADSGDTGRYQVPDLPSGTFTARTSTFDYADELWDGLPCEPTCVPTPGTPIAVTAGQVHDGVDFGLLRLGSFSGRVVDAASGAAVENADVLAFDDQGVLRASAQTDASGAYRVGGLPAGSFRARTTSVLHLDELFDDIPCEGGGCMPAAGTPIPVALGSDAGGIDFRLVRGGWITGRVVRQATSEPVEFAFVTVYLADGSLLGAARTGGAGVYVFPGLASGSYRAVAANFDYAPELYLEMPCPSTGCVPTAGTPIAVLVSQETAGIDFTLARLGRITGRVRDVATLLPVSTFVRAHRSDGQGVGTDVTDASGSYLIDRLSPGTYFLATDGFSGQNFVDELYDDIPCEPSCDVTQGTPVVVALDATASGIDFHLRRPVFADVPVEHFAWRFAEAVYAAGITSGCASAPLRFCPNDPVSRDQMAVLLLRAKEGASYQPPPATGVFTDVPASGIFAPWIEDLAARGIAAGCAANPPRYCPADATTRAQMAPLLLLTKEGGGFTPPPAVGVFQDLAASSPFARWVEELVRRGVTGGCSVSPSLYCPGQATTRAQMAVFLTTTFALPLP